MKNHYWTFEKDGKFFDAEFSSKDEAQAWAEEAFSDECLFDNLKRSEADILLVRFHHDEETGEIVKDELVKSCVEFEYYRGDLLEHGTY
jgi:hypothetical protein